MKIAFRPLLKVSPSRISPGFKSIQTEWHPLLYAAKDSKPIPIDSPAEALLIALSDAMKGENIIFHPNAADRGIQFRYQQVISNETSLYFTPVGRYRGNPGTVQQKALDLILQVTGKTPSDIAENNFNRGQKILKLPPTPLTLYLVLPNL